MLLLWIIRPPFHSLGWDVYNSDMQLWWFQQEKLSGYIICKKKKKKTIFSKNVEVQADTCSVPCGGTGDLISRERHTFEMLIPQIWEAAYEMTSGRITSHKDVPGLFPRNCANTWQKGLCGRDWGSWSWEIILNHSGPDDREFSQNRRCGDHRSRSWDDGRRKPQGKEHRKPPEAAEDEEANSP